MKRDVIATFSLTRTDLSEHEQSRLIKLLHQTWKGKGFWTLAGVLRLENITVYHDGHLHRQEYPPKKGAR